MPDFYLIPGMGADQRLYTHFDLPGEMHKLNWWPHGKAKSLAEYAAILAEQIKTTDNVIIGSSMGGMVASELSHLIKPRATILVSAPTGRHQFPTVLKFFDGMRIHKVLTPGAVMRISSLADLFMGFKTKEQRALFYDMLKGNGPEFLHFSIDTVLGWKNIQEPSGPYIQIIGSKDKLFKKSRIPHAVVLEGGGHFTAYEMGREVSAVICDFLEKQTVDAGHVQELLV